MKILSIGNSFSEDAHRYLHQIAKMDQFNIKTVNLCIGGCSLATHYKKINNDAKEYAFTFNGENTAIFVTLKEAVQSDDWDFITFQQASHQSFSYDYYQPYLSRISEYVSYHSPKSKQLIHQTWAYEQGSEKLLNLGYKDHKNMFHDIKTAYKTARDDINAYGIIPAGQCMQNLLSNGIKKVHRDGFHADLGVGRFAIALTWYIFLTGNTPSNLYINDSDQEISDIEIEIAKNSAIQAVKC